jgi:ATP-dependent DNA helicase RecG
MTLLSSRQALLMAPTELLAKQHYQKLKDLFDKYGFKTCLLTSDISKKEKEKLIEKIRLNEFDLVVSTQAILYQKNIFNNLGIIVIDEQHRFGVKQRSQLLSDYNDCDALYLTATPIPRTLGLSQIGDLKLSEVHTKPSGRKDIKTFVIDYQDLNSLKSKINDEINLGHQIFVIANKIDEDDNKYDLSKAFSLFKELAPNARIEKINGRLKEETKNKIMTSFLNKEFDILVSTTVIEVGIDIKDATMMFILNSENFGLATLHQLRGRVGRNDLDSYCYLVTDDTLNER